MLQIKSRDRVRDLAEVYTNEREVKAMLDLIPIKKEDDIIAYRYLEPACGNGNFLIEVLRRKLHRINHKYAHRPMQEFEFYHARVLTTIYGIDICKENVAEAIERLYREVKSNIDLHKGSYIYSPGFFPLIRYILKTNIVIGDSINRPDRIEFTEFIVKGRSFERRVYNFSDLFQSKPLPKKTMPAENFLLIGQRFQLESKCNDELGQTSFNLEKE